MISDDDYAEVVETAAKALAERDGDTCFGPLRDTVEWQEVRARYRATARVALEAVNHRGYLHGAARINALLREHGFEFPTGVRGVEDALNMLTGLRGDMKDPAYLRERLAYAERKATT